MYTLYKSVYSSHLNAYESFCFVFNQKIKRLHWSDFFLLIKTFPAVLTTDFN